MRRSSRTPTVALALGVAVVTTGISRTAHAADPQEQQLAQALFEEGRRLIEQKRYPEACPKLAESQRLDPAAGTLLNLAICHEKEGKVATAQVEYSESLAIATRDGRRDRQLIARERLAAIDRLVPRLTIVLAPGASEIDGLELELDGLVLRRAAWGIATPVDPGTHVVAAKAPGRTPWSSSVVVDASQKKTIDVPVISPLAPLPLGGGGLGTPSQPPLQPPPGTARPTLVPVPAPVYYEDATSTDDSSPLVGRPNPVFYTTLAITLVAATTATLTGYLAVREDAAAKEGCLPDRRYCRDQTSMDAADSAATLAVASTVTLGIAAAGVVALLVFPSRVSGTKLTGSSSPRGGAFVLSGTF